MASSGERRRYERSHVAPAIRPTELPAIVEEALASHVVVEAKRRVAELREEYERVDAALDEPPRRFRHHPPAQAQPVVLPTQVDLAQLPREFPLVWPARGESDQSSVPVLEHEDEVPPILLREHLIPLRGARRDRRSARGVVRRVPCRDVQFGQRRDVSGNRVAKDDRVERLASFTKLTSVRVAARPRSPVEPAFQRGDPRRQALLEGEPRW